MRYKIIITFFLMNFFIPIAFSSFEIGNTYSEWEFTNVKQDEFNMMITLKNESDFETCFNVDLIVYNFTKVLSKDYSWKMELSYYNVLSSKEEPKILADKQAALDVNKERVICIPPYVDTFTLKAGENSTTVIGNVQTNVMIYVHTENLCRNGSGAMFAAYYGNDVDPHVARSTDNGSTWTDYDFGISFSCESSIGIVCNQNQSLFFYCEEGSNFIGAISDDGGASFKSDFTLLGTGGKDMDDSACVSDSNSVIHCCSIDSTGDALYYVNSTDWGTFNIVNNDGSNDSDLCDIAVDSQNKPWIAAIGSNRDDVQVWSTRALGWGSASGIIVDNEGSMNFYGSPDIEIGNNGSTDYIYIAHAENNDGVFCNSTSENYEEWDCTNFNDVITAGEISMTTTSDGKYIEIFSIQNIGGSGGKLMRTNSSSYGSAWTIYSELRSEISYVYASLGGSLWPESNRMEEYPGVAYVSVNTTATDSFFWGNYTYHRDPTGPPADSCTCVTNGNWLVQCSDNCVLTGNCEMQLGTNLTVQGSGSLTFLANLTGWDTIDVGGCDVDINVFEVTA